MLGWKTSSQGSWSSGFTLNATVLAQEIHRSPRKMSCRCATSASLSDRERPTPEWEAYKNCSDYESPRGKPNDSSPGFLFYAFAASKWPLGIERHALSLLKKTYPFLKASVFSQGSFLFCRLACRQTAPLKGMEPLGLWWNKVLITGFYVVRMAAGGRRNHQDMSSALRR